MDSKRWARIEAVFSRIIDAQPEDRSRLLAEECGDDRELAAAVMELVASHDAEPEFLEAPVARVSDFAEALDTPANRVIGPYRLIRVLGRGGMGEVFLATQEGEGFERPVALKVIRPGMDTREVLERFRLERRILAQLRHPHIAQLLDAGVTEDGRPFVAMEYVDGVPVDEFCDDRGLSLPDRIELFRSICDAVQHAHVNLVLHRDLKPANILVSPEGVPKLLDFGIAKLVTPDLETGAATQTAMRRLTPEYAAPEQIRGGAVSVATDVYGLGVLLFELLTGRRPYTRDGESWGELERAILDRDAPRPSTVLEPGTGPEARRRKRTLSGDLDRIVLKALRKEPERRYVSAAALAEDLERYSMGHPVRARPDTLGYRTSKFVRRNALPLSAAAAVFLALAGIAGTNARQARIMAEQRDEALEVRAFLLETFGGTGADQAAGDSVTVRQLLDAQASTLDGAYGDRPELHSEMMMVLAEGYDRLGVLDRAETLAANALALRRDMDGSEAGDLAASMALLGWIRHQGGRSDEAAALLEESVTLFDSEGGRPQELARALNDLGVVREALGEYDEAERHYGRALDLRRSVVGEGHRSFAVTASNLSVIRYRKGDFDGAVDAATEALEAMRRSVGSDHQRSIVVQSNLAAFRVALGDNPSAVAEYRDLLERQGRLRGENHPVTLGVAMSLGSVLTNAGEWAEAEAILERVVRAQEERLGADNPNVGVVLIRWAQPLIGLGRRADAEVALERALGLLRPAVGEDHPRVAEGVETLADAVEPRDPERSEALHLQALGILGRINGESHPATAESVMRLGDRYTRWDGRADDAFAAYRRAHEVFLKELPPHHPNVHRSRVRMALTAWETGRVELVDSVLAEARAGFASGGADPRIVALADSLTTLTQAGRE